MQQLKYVRNKYCFYYIFQLRLVIFTGLLFYFSNMKFYFNILYKYNEMSTDTDIYFTTPVNDHNIHNT